MNEAAKEVLAGETVPTVLHAFKAQLEQMEVVDAPTVKAAIKAVQRNWRKGKIFHANPCSCIRTNAWSRIA